MHIRTYLEQDEPDVIALWKQVLPDDAPHNDPATSIRQKLAVDRELFLVAEVAGRVVATAIGGYDGHRGWIYTVAVAPEHRHRGIGSGLVRQVEAALVARLLKAESASAIHECKRTCVLRKAGIQRRTDYFPGKAAILISGNLLCLRRRAVRLTVVRRTFFCVGSANRRRNHALHYRSVASHLIQFPRARRRGNGFRLASGDARRCPCSR